MKKMMKNKFPELYYAIKGTKDKWIYQFKKNPYPKKLINEKKFIIFGVPEHGNLGDQAIIKAEVDFLKKHHPEYKIIEIPLDKTILHAYFLKNFLRKGDMVFFHGGGNLGDLYLSNEIARRSVLKIMKNKPIILFPQSYTFTSSKSAHTEKKISQKIYSFSKDNFTLIARESKSLNLLKKYFPANKILYTPDIVLTLDERKNMKRSGILLCLRNDSEKVISEANQNSLIDALKGKYNEITLTDTIVKYNVFEKNRAAELEKKWTEYHKSQVVITDRLHGMIFAVITGTPCIVFDNYNSKVRQTYQDWLSDYENIKFVDVLNDFSVSKISDLIDEIKDGEVPLFVVKNKYSPLLDEINKKMMINNH